MTEFTSWGKKQGTSASHWGVSLDLTKPTTGVFNLSTPEFIGDEMFAQGAIDLAWEEHVEECKGMCSQCRCNHEGDKCDCYSFSSRPIVAGHEYDPDEDEHEGCGPQERGTVLIGSWKKDEDGKYVPDESGEYAAICNEIYGQVVWSRHVKHCAPCSPCYPGQADLDNEVPADGDGFLCYDLPPDVYGERHS